jgi:hypothetical protein
VAAADGIGGGPVPPPACQTRVPESAFSASCGLSDDRPKASSKLHGLPSGQPRLPMYAWAATSPSMSPAPPMMFSG